MKEVLNDIDRWRAAGKRVAVARVVGIEGSGPRLPGAAMAVNEDGEVAGSVSGGCVEGAVVTEALDILRRRPAPAVHVRLLRRRGLRRRADLRRHHPPVHRAARLVSGRSTTTWPRPSGPRSRWPWRRSSRGPTAARRQAAGPARSRAAVGHPRRPRPRPGRRPGRLRRAGRRADRDAPLRARTARPGSARSRCSSSRSPRRRR